MSRSVTAAAATPSDTSTAVTIKCLPLLTLVACIGEVPIDSRPDAGGDAATTTDAPTTQQSYRYYLYAASSTGLRGLVIDPTTKALGNLVNPSTANTLSLAVDPLGRFVFAAERQANNTYSYATYAVNPTTGALTRGGARASTHQFPYAMAVGPSGLNLFSGDVTTSRLASYAIDQTTGALTPVNDIGVVVNSSSYSEMQVHRTGSVVYFASNALRTALVAPNGALTAGASLADALSTVQLSENFLFTGPQFGADDIDVYRVDATSGALTAVNTVAVGDGVSRLATDPSGRFLFVPRNDTITTYMIGANGSLTATSTIVVKDPDSNPANFFSVAMHPAGGMLYAHSRGSDTIHQLAVDESGALTSAGSAVTNLGDVYIIRLLRVEEEP